MMQKLKRSWIASSKLTWGIWRIWPEHSKISNICTLMGCFWPKYIMLELQNYREVIFHDTRKWHEEFSKFLPEHVRRSKNCDFDGILLSKVENLQGNCVAWQWRTMQNVKRNWLVSSKLTRGIWQILTGTLGNLKILHCNVPLLTKVYNVWAEKLQRSYIWWYWILMQNLKQNWLVLSKMTWVANFY